MTKVHELITLPIKEILRVSRTSQLFSQLTKEKIKEKVGKEKERSFAYEKALGLAEEAYERKERELA